MQRGRKRNGSTSGHNPRPTSNSRSTHNMRQSTSNSDVGRNHAENSNSRGKKNMHRNQSQLHQNQDAPNQKQFKCREAKLLSFKFLETLVEKDPQDIFLTLCDGKSGFQILLNSNEITNDKICLIVALIAKLCKFSFNNAKNDFIKDVFKSNFKDKLISFITSIIVQTDREKKLNSYFWSDTDAFWLNIIQISDTVCNSIPSCSKDVQNILNSLKVFFPMIESRHQMHISDSIKESVNNLIDLVERKIECSKARILLENSGIIDDYDVEPPDDFRQIQIIPSIRELLEQPNTFLRANITNKAYRDVDHYLDVQFRLLREDFVAPLRDGIITYRKNQTLPKKSRQKVDNIKFYENVKFLNEVSMNEMVCYKINLNVGKSKMNNMKLSKRFMFGSLVCLTKDNFVTLLFGKVAEKNVEDFKKGIIVLSFDEQVAINYSANYLLIESTVYFEPYYHVLNTLQTMNSFEFPMEKYIIKIENDVRPPKYLLGNVVSVGTTDLNPSQVTAFKAALNEELCIIQGPPGTGKTYIGLKIVLSLLSRSNLWFCQGPLLVVCYTNHALDQFLEYLLPYTDSILRVGGQSKSQKLQEYNLVNRKRKGNFEKLNQVGQERRNVKKLLNEISNYTDTLSLIQSNNCVLRFDCFKSVIDNYDCTWFKNASDKDVITWLMAEKHGYLRDNDSVNMTEEYEESTDSSEDEDDFNNPNDVVLDDIFRQSESTPILNVLMSIKGFQSLVENIQVAIQKYKNKNSTESSMEKMNISLIETKANLNYLKAQLNSYNSTQNYSKRYNYNNPYLMPAADRWGLYFFLRDLLTVKLRKDLSDIRTTFNRHYRLYSDLRDIENAHVMRRHKVIGMTTTAAARLRSTLEQIACPIVIVEEAAEVLEAHIITSLSKDCQHLILIGDHLQLKPSTANYRIEKRFNLGISLFERMVRNNIKCHTLNVQHRMRPEISSLIRPSIYENLIDHSTTENRKMISGMNKCLYFIHHYEQENEENESSSKSNEHEVKFFIELAKRLILNGYQQNQITILAAYLNQMFLFKQYIKQPNNKKLLERIPVCVLDNYQGEESDIILLSLVRSNKDGVAGFLKIQNRVCVALSRARNGLYIMGNMKLLLNCRSENDIWGRVNKTLEDQEAIGEFLPLKCKNHPNEKIFAKTAEDFKPFSGGGCHRTCMSLLPCGHSCQKLCHMVDMDHSLSKCKSPCGRVLCSNPNHMCKKKCYEECGPCTYNVNYILSCEHPVSLPCHMDPNKYDCKFPVPTKLPCGHDADKPCYIDEYTFSCPVDCKKRLECGHTCKLTCHVRSDPDHLDYICNQQCARPRRDCKSQKDENEIVHRCQKLCHEECEECLIPVKRLRSCGHMNDILCKEDVEILNCIKPCKKILPCKHKCKNKCCEECGPCEVKVKKGIPDCNHLIEVKCCVTPLRAMCKSKVCQRQLPCGHMCQEQCKNECTQICRELVKCNIKFPCGHIINSIMCYLQNEKSTEVLLKNCPYPCDTILKCNHQCSGTCGQCMQSRLHLKCTQKCGVPLVCSHECTIPCREACRPCSKPCQIKCAHSSCPLTCGQPCTLCKEICTRKCNHVKCNKLCGQICDISPCIEKCNKVLKCKHSCVGFCNDPCPNLCRVCDKEELTEIFLGSEDDPDAIYVMLNDCKHIFESNDLERWMKMDENQIKFKVCPRCSTGITTTERYSHYIKRSLQDIAAAKVMSYGITEENVQLRTELIVDIRRLEMIIPLGFNLFSTNFNIMRERLKPIRYNRKQSINKLELHAIKSKIQLLTNIWNALKQMKPPYNNKVMAQCNLICNVLARSEDQITNQEIEDIKYETMRLSRIVQFNKLQLSFSSTFQKWKILEQYIDNLLFQPSRYDLNLDSRVSAYLKNLSKEINVVITDAERIEIVNAIGLAKGHWYKCPNGHPYAIGECGGANQIAKCLCGAEIGGTNHHLLRSNDHAGEMDGSERHAWPGGLH